MRLHVEPAERERVPKLVEEHRREHDDDPNGEAEVLQPGLEETPRYMPRRRNAMTQKNSLDLDIEPEQRKTQHDARLS